MVKVRTVVRVESVNSLMQEAAVRVLDASTVSNPPHCRRRTQAASMSAMADNAPVATNSELRTSENRPLRSPDTLHSYDRYLMETGRAEIKYFRRQLLLTMRPAGNINVVANRLAHAAAP